MASHSELTGSGSWRHSIVPNLRNQSVISRWVAGNMVLTYKGVVSVVSWHLRHRVWSWGHVWLSELEDTAVHPYAFYDWLHWCWYRTSFIYLHFSVIRSLGYIHAGNTVSTDHRLPLDFFLMQLGRRARLRILFQTSSGNRVDFLAWCWRLSYVMSFRFSQSFSFCCYLSFFWEVEECNCIFSSFTAMGGYKT